MYQRKNVRSSFRNVVYVLLRAIFGHDRYVWDSKDRSVTLYYLYDNTGEIMELLAAKSKSLSLNFENDVISLYANRFIPSYAGGSHTGSFNPPSSFPLYYDGKRAGTGFRYQEIHFFQSDSGSLTLEEGFYTFGHYYDTAVIKEAADNYIIPKPTYEDAIKYFTEDMYGDVLDRADTDECTFLYITQGTPHGNNEFLIRIAKDGSYKDYADEFKSVSLYGTKAFSNVRIENGKVYFHYDKDYVIDLRTGIMTVSP